MTPIHPLCIDTAHESTPAPSRAAAALLLGVHPASSLVLSAPAPAIQARSSVHSLHRALFAAPPLPLAEYALLRLSLSPTERQPTRLPSELVALEGPPRTPRAIRKLAD